jgi:hypothetical protein
MLEWLKPLRERRSMPGKSDVSISDLLREGFLTAGANLYHPSGAVATVGADGTIAVTGGLYQSPTLAHLAVTPVSRNGWLVWHLQQERGSSNLAALRDQYRTRMKSAEA